MAKTGQHGKAVTLLSEIQRHMEQKMALTLAKNQTISLEKTAGTGLKKVSMGLGWDPEKASGFFGKLLGGGGGDIDRCLVHHARRRQKAPRLVWFRQLQSRDGAIQHSGDNRTGEGAGDDETISVDLENCLPPSNTRCSPSIRSPVRISKKSPTPTAVLSTWAAVTNWVALICPKRSAHRRGDVLSGAHAVGLGLHCSRPGHQRSHC